MNKNPLVSVIIPTRNSEEFLDGCLKSIKNQTYRNIEIIVVDNNSTDITKKIAQKYTNKVFNQGPERSKQRNFGVSRSGGDYILIIDSDMVLSKKVIESCVIKIQENENVRGIIIPEESFGKGFWAECKKLEKSFYIGIEWMEAARFFPKSAFLKIGGYDEKIISGEDWDLSQRLKQLGKISRINNLIFHNEGTPTLLKLIRKKYYYASKIQNYLVKVEHYDQISDQLNIIKRFSLFISKPQKLLKNPLIGIGLIFMKICEFSIAGFGLVISRLKGSGEVIYNNYSLIIKNEILPSISFIIPTYNAEKYLSFCLASIKKQDYPPNKIEILVIDGGSLDKTLQIAKQYHTIILENKKRIAEYGKAIGIRKSKGDFFILIDSDNEIVESNWLKKMVTPILQNPDIFGVESPLATNGKLSSLNQYFARIRIADPLAKMLASKPIEIEQKFDYKIIKFSSHCVLVTGANGFLWNKKLVIRTKGWDEKFEEANYSTFIHQKTNQNYAIPFGVSIRHYYCENIPDYIGKRLRIANKMCSRLQNNETTWISNVHKAEFILFTLYLISVIGPFCEAIYRSIKDKTAVWFWHPLISFFTIIIYTYVYLKFLVKEIYE